MNANQPSTDKNRSPMTALVIIEAVIILLMLAFAIYLAVKIVYYKTTSKLTATSSGNITDADCPAGKTGTSAGADYKVLGQEKFTFVGKEMSLCCATANDKTTEAKVCSDKANDYVVHFSRVGGQYVMAMQMYPQGEKRCIKSFKESGESAEVCL